MRRLLSALLFIVVPLPAYAIDPGLNWKTLETEHFYIHFADDQQFLAQHVAGIAERANQKLSLRLRWQPLEKTHLVLSDETDLSNGYAIPFPFNRSVLFMAPPDDLNTLEDFDDWLALLVEHEYVHILHLDTARGGPQKLRRLLGRNVLLFPNMYQPPWIIEGLATYYETNSERHIGRGQSTLFETMMAQEVANGIKPVSQVNLHLRSWPMGTTYYLYGVHFFQFLEQTYGVQAVDDLIDRYSYHLIPFMINTNAEAVLGKDITELWDEFEIWLQKRYADWPPNSADRVQGERVSDAGYFTGAVKATSDGGAYYVKAGAFEHAALYRIDTDGAQQRVAETHVRARLDVNDKAGVLIAQPEYCDVFNLNFDLFVLQPGAHELKQITECGRYRSATWSADGSQIIAVHNSRSLSELHLLDANGRLQQVIWKGEYGEVVGQPDWSPDARYLVASVFRPGMGWNIERFDVQQRQWLAVTNDAYIDANPVFNDDGSAIVFSSERNGHYDIYRYRFEQNQLQRLTAVGSGAFAPSQLNQQLPLYYLGYGANGYDIYRMAAPPALSESVYEMASRQETEPLAEDTSTPYELMDYSPWSSLAPRWWFPLLVLDEQQSEVGFTTSGNDALGIHNYVLNLGYDTKNRWPMGNLTYRYSRYFASGFGRSTSILLDQNGDFAVARREDRFFANAVLPWLKMDYSFNLLGGVFLSRERDGRRAGGIQPLPVLDDNLLGVAALFNNSDYYIRSISPNNGRDLRLIAESGDAFDSDYSGEVYTLDWREYLPLGGQHVLALRLLRGYGTDHPKDFKLGGEETDFLLQELFYPVQKSLFGRRDYPLRGYREGLPQLRGRRMQMASIEYRFPIGLVERGWMAPPVGLIQWSGALFADSGATWENGASPDTYYTGVGMELNAEVSLFYGLNLQGRIGVASGLDEQLGEDRVYFSLGAAF